jgi:hypothetical protein
MNFDLAIVNYPDGRVVRVSPSDFLAIPLSDRIQLLTGGRIKFERDHQIITALEALKQK